MTSDEPRVDPAGTQQPTGTGVGSLPGPPGPPMGRRPDAPPGQPAAAVPYPAMSSPQDLPPPWPGLPRQEHSLEDPNSKGLGVAAFVCAVIPIPLTVIAGVVMAIIVLSRGRQRAGRGRGWAIGALAAVAGWLLVLAGVIAFAVSQGPDRTDGVVTSSGRVAARDLRVGDCHTQPTPDTLTLTVKVQPCSTPHDSEVYGTFELDAGPYPGDRLVTGAAEEGCVDRWQAFVGLAYDESDLALYYFVPSRDTWTDRTVICSVAQEGTMTTGTLAGSAH